MKTKKKNPFLSVLKVFLIVLLVLVAVVAIWCTFSAFNKKDVISLLPNDYSVYIKTESLWDALNPIVDLQVADVILSAPELSKARGALISFRQSPLRNNKYIDFAASRPVDVGIYMNENVPSILGIIDMGVFSAASRLAKVVLPMFKVKGLSLVKTESDYYFEYATPEGESVAFIKPYYNTVVFSTSKDLLLKSCAGNNEANYTEEEIELLTKKIDNPIKIIADARSLTESFTENEPTLSKMTNLLSQETKALISLDIKDSEIYAKADIPLEANLLNVDTSLQGVNALLNQSSSMPQLLGHLSNIVQYYTIINAGTLEQITQAVFPIIPEDVDINSLWKTGNSLSKTFFSLTLEELLFSWTGKECAAVGIEGLNAPVFVLQIKDEAKRR